MSQFTQQPNEAYWEGALRVVRYPKGNPRQGIFLGHECDLQPYRWYDSDWAGCPLTRRSLTGWLVSFGHFPVSGKTKKQHTVSRSSAKVKYHSMAMATCEPKWLKRFYRHLE